MKYKINLLTRRREKTLDKVIYFALNYLRYILVITQIVVIGVFFYRIKVDQEIVDLEDAINQKKEIVEVSQPLIKKGRIASYKLERATSIINDQESHLLSLNYLLTVFPEGFFLKKMEIAEKTLSLKGITGDINLIRAFFNHLKKDARFGKVNLASIKKIEDGFEFVFELNQFKK